MDFHRLISAALSCVLVLLIPIGAIIGTAERAVAAQGGTLEGRVLHRGRPIEGVRVSLLSDGYSPLTSIYTDGSGRFRFRVGAGSYYIEVDPLGLPFERVQQRVDIDPSPFSAGNEIFRSDVNLTPTKPKGDTPGPGGVRFAQQVPDAARTEYDRGVKLIEKDPDAGCAAMKKAMEIFPDYYQAMETLGSAYVKADRLDDALPVLTHAIEVNPSGELCHYALGVLYYKKARVAEAAQSFEKATSLNPKSANATLYLGLSLARSGEREKAETTLRRAYDLGAKNVADLHLALAKIYLDTKRNHEAAAQLKLLLKEVPKLQDRDKIKGLIEKLEKS